MDNTKRRAGRAVGPSCQMKNMNFSRTTELHSSRAGRPAALQDGPVGCTLSWSGEKGGTEGCPFLQPARGAHGLDIVFIGPGLRIPSGRVGYQVFLSRTGSGLDLDFVICCRRMVCETELCL